MEKRSIKEWIVRTCILLAGLTIVIKSDAGTGPNDLVAVVLSDKLHRSFSVVRLLVDDGERVQVDALAPEALSAFLKAFFDDDAGADQLRAGLADQFAQTENCFSVGEEIVDDQDFVFGVQEAL